MGRLHFLKQTLPNWIRLTPFPIIVVDYSCPDGTADWIRDGSYGPRVSVIRRKAERRQGRPVFNPSRARNAGAAAVREGFILFFDADTLIEPGFMEWIRARLDPGRMIVVQRLRSKRWGSELGGTLLVHVRAFRKAGGFDEDLEGWGTEDTEIKVRLCILGIGYRHIPSHLIQALHHSSALRVENHIEKDLFASQRRNQKIADQKIRTLTGRTFTSWLGNPKIQRLLRD